jgi:hypothetical protein
MNRDAGSSRLAGPSIGTLSVVDSDVVRLRITAGRHHISAITMVDGFSDLPAAIQDETRKQGSDASDGSDIKGKYHQGTIYLSCPGESALGNLG